uniref:Uncharacterized protein n=1 Tax=viral metagenome TaxID=1070528 RepID=A0A6M3J2S0_9ZZZZ
MGNYVLNTEIVDKKGLASAAVDVIISYWEKFVEFYCQDIFYKKTNWSVYFNGNGKQIVFFPGLPDIISISSMYSIDSDGVETLIAADNYKYKSYCVKYGIWARGFRNYRMVCDIGHDTLDRNGNTDEKYKPEAIKEAIRMLVVNTLDTYYGTTSGTTTQQSSTGLGDLSSESIGDYSWSRREKNKTLLQTDDPTDIPIVNMLLQPYKNRRPQLQVIDSNLNDYEDDESLMEVYK